eukprot:TRINITY_DN91348_c0_g1_i1.p1 TRINITY_DN91348_c0_g1~~TRINITY_DN91348_c0_g1_i1.p1  ORF type:complete len:317 (+),score=66.92 TRINITY_DN91348_c0_g1_i1:49-999(+)
MLQLSFRLAILTLGAASAPASDLVEDHAHACAHTHTDECQDDDMAALQLTKREVIDSDEELMKAFCFRRKNVSGLMQEVPNKVHLKAAEVGEPCTLGDRVKAAGDTYCVPKVKKPATDCIRSGQVFEKDTHTWIEKYVKDMSRSGDVVTMGLFFGDFLPHMSNLVGDGQRVWGLEPNPSNFKHARGTIWENSIKNAWIANAGGDDSDGFFDMCLETKGAPCGGQCSVEQADCTLSATIPTVTLDRLIPEDRCVNLIHLDVEGFEEHVLAGAERVIQQWKPIVVLENGDRDPLKNFMTEMGYKMVKHVDANHFWMAS